MAKYVDGFVIPIKKQTLAAYEFERGGTIRSNPTGTPMLLSGGGVATCAVAGFSPFAKPALELQSSLPLYS